MNIRNVADLKRYLIDTIKSFLEIRGIKELEAYDVSEGDSPIVFENCDDADGTYTLDRIRVSDEGKIFLYADSGYYRNLFLLERIPVDYIEGIRDWLFDNEENIRENVLGEEMEEE